jgi:hypothetical protein
VLQKDKKAASDDHSGQVIYEIDAVSLGHTSQSRSGFNQVHHAMIPPADATQCNKATLYKGLQTTICIPVTRGSFGERYPFVSA